MGRSPCFSEEGLNRGPWTAKENALLTNYIQQHGEGHWRHLPQNAGLLRCGTSCRLRWVNYLRPNIKRGNIAPDEEDLIIRLHTLLGNRWSLIAKCLPGRTDNEMIKNYWNTHLSKRSLEKTTSSDHLKSSKETKKTLKKKKKKNQTTIINHEQANEESAKTKIYLPKAIRVSPYLFTFRNSSFDSTIESSSSDRFDIREANGGERGQTLSDLEEERSNINGDHVNDFNSSSLDFSKIFEEYEQLLKSSEDQVNFD